MFLWGRQEDQRERSDPASRGWNHDGPQAKKCRNWYQFHISSVQFNCSAVSNSATPWTTARQASLSITNSRSPPKPMSIESVMPSNHLILCCSFFCLQSFPASGSFLMSQLFASSGQSITASASVLPVNIQGWFPLGSTSLICCSPRDSQESSQIPQFESINSSAISFLYSTTFTPMHDHWKNHNLN